MQGGQVPLWTPLVVALLGIIGVVAGQLVNAHREDRRWRREQVRDDVRWARERRRWAEERESETERYWRDQRLRIYTAFLAAISNLRVEMRYAGDTLQESAELDQPRRERLLDLAATARDLYAPLGVVGPADVRDQATELIRISAALLGGHLVDTAPLLALVRNFAATTRQVLGTEPKDPAGPSTESP
ncbi:hypothetical protein [Amycolatopsis sp. EV170708-02-1]|uniref:hypothetical protein n=1 Tax=Amycolatopsis sp. EV170708-02-1 TaxID=2919322 RepID=UPI001F0C42E3|nr:hypothetical protein [Amycolatopsis sp. EV170708-02-1]UMP05406.1 hypothetical protein MJQ72_11500 [Amycolatopsis sp. EV170708-02-1]